MCIPAPVDIFRINCQSTCVPGTTSSILHSCSRPLIKRIWVNMHSRYHPRYHLRCQCVTPHNTDRVVPPFIGFFPLSLSVMQKNKRYFPKYAFFTSTNVYFFEYVHNVNPRNLYGFMKGGKKNAYNFRKLPTCIFTTRIFFHNFKIKRIFFKKNSPA